MSSRTAETIQRIREFQGETRECSMQMMMNALYIQKELTNVRMSDELRGRVVRLCSDLIGTKHDLITEIFELDEALESGATNVEVLRRIDRMEQWAMEDALKMHEIVKSLEKEAEEDVMRTGAYLLVSESATNILMPLKRMRKLAAELRGELG